MGVAVGMIIAILRLMSMAAAVAAAGNLAREVLVIQGLFRPVCPVYRHLVAMAVCTTNLLVKETPVLPAILTAAAAVP